MTFRLTQAYGAGGIGQRLLTSSPTIDKRKPVHPSWLRAVKKNVFFAVLFKAQSAR